MILWLLTLESSKISTPGLCCEWFPDCDLRIKQDSHTWSLLMIPWLLPSNQENFHTWYSLWMIATLQSRFSHLVCAESRIASLESRFLHMVFAVIDFLIASFESSKISTHCLWCEWFPDCYPRMKQGFHNWSLLWTIPWLLPSNKEFHIWYFLNDSLIATLDSNKNCTTGICCEWFPDCDLWIKVGKIPTPGLCC